MKHAASVAALIGLVALSVSTAEQRKKELVVKYGRILQRPGATQALATSLASLQLAMEELHQCVERGFAILDDRLTPLERRVEILEDKIIKGFP